MASIDGLYKENASRGKRFLWAAAMSSADAALLQQRIHARFAATEGDEARHAGAAATGREDFVAEAGAGRRIEDAFFFKRREAVR